jgi:hypothetical protein
LLTFRRLRSEVGSLAPNVAGGIMHTMMSIPVVVAVAFVTEWLVDG